MSGRSSNVDMMGRDWSDDRLSEILGEPSVMFAVEAAAEAALSRDGRRYSMGALQVFACRRYRRKEAVALFVLLVQRYFELGFYDGSGEASA